MGLQGVSVDRYRRAADRLGWGELVQPAWADSVHKALQTCGKCPKEELETTKQLWVEK